MEYLMKKFSFLLMEVKEKSGNFPLSQGKLTSFREVKES